MSTTTSVRAPQSILHLAGMAENTVLRIVAKHGDELSYALAMGLAAFYQRLIEGGVPPAAAGDAWIGKVP